MKPNPPQLRNPKGKRLSAHKALVAVALHEQGLSTRKAGKIAGCSPSSVLNYTRKNLLPHAQVEAIRKHLRDEFAVVAHDALAAVNQEKLKEAGVGELVRAAAVASDRAGLSPPSVTERYITSIAKYVIRTTPSATSADGDTPTSLLT